MATTKFNITHVAHIVFLFWFVRLSKTFFPPAPNTVKFCITIVTGKMDLGVKATDQIPIFYHYHLDDYVQLIFLYIREKT